MARFLFILFLTLASYAATAQQVYRGIVVDSLRLTNLSDVYVSVKNKGTGTVTNAQGSFLIYAKPTDTLVFSLLGYKSIVLPLLFEEDALFILLAESAQLLSEVTISGKRLYPNKIEDRTKMAPRKMEGWEALRSPISYFWKGEREKRKLNRIVEENNRTQTFRQVITDPDVMKILMDDYDVSEEMYYQLISKFNQKQVYAHYLSDPDAIMEALHAFFEKNIRP